MKPLGIFYYITFSLIILVFIISLIVNSYAYQSFNDFNDCPVYSNNTTTPTKPTGRTNFPINLNNKNMTIANYVLIICSIIPIVVLFIIQLDKKYEV